MLYFNANLRKITILTRNIQSYNFSKPSSSLPTCPRTVWASWALKIREWDRAKIFLYNQCPKPKI